MKLRALDGCGPETKQARAMQETVLEQFVARGLVAQVTHPDQLAASLAEGPLTFYIGYDPTAASLHAGHLVTLMAARRLAEAGHRPICLVGGGTAMVGDPSGKTEARKELAAEVIAANARSIGQQIKHLIGPERSLLLVDNASWLGPLTCLSFLRDTGRHFRVGRMLSSETYKSRLNEGLTFFEFAYQLLQAYDFSHLLGAHDCRLQLGGDDQWSSMLAGVDLCRRRGQPQAFALTVPLITTAGGAKMGKSVGGALWLDASRTSVSDFYQYWINVDDRDLLRFLRLLTTLPLADIAAVEHMPKASCNAAKSILAWEVTAWVHGTEAARLAATAAMAAFGDRTLPLNLLPTSNVPRSLQPVSDSVATHDVAAEAPLSLVALLVALGFAASNNAARRLLQQGGVSLDGERLTDADASIVPAAWPAETALLRAGKKRFVRLRRVV